MSTTELQALRHPHIAAFHKFFSEYHIFFDVEAERFRVVIRVYETGDGRYFFEQSHHLRTPIRQLDRELAAERHAAPHAALSCAVETITTYYEEAVGLGHEPCRDWFVHNPSF